MRRLVTAENMVIAYKSRARAENWVAWVQDNPEMAKLLAEVEINK